MAFFFSLSFLKGSNHNKTHQDLTPADAAEMNWDE